MNCCSLCNAWPSGSMTDAVPCTRADFGSRKSSAALSAGVAGARPSCHSGEIEAAQHTGCARLNDSITLHIAMLLRCRSPPCPNMYWRRNASGTNSFQTAPASAQVWPLTLSTAIDAHDTMAPLSSGIQELARSCSNTLQNAATPFTMLQRQTWQ